MGSHHSHHHHHHGHHHSHDDHAHDHDDNAGEKALNRIRFAFYLNFFFAAVELIGGSITGSFAIVADAIHDLGDSLSLALALYLQKKSLGGPSKSLPYGYLRYSVVSAIISGIVIISGSVVVFIEAIKRLLEPQELPRVAGMLGLAIVGVVVNTVAALRLSHGHTHNEKILSWHFIEDIMGWVVVLIGAVFIYYFKIAWIDPVLAIGISIFISWNVIRNLKEPLRIILQYVPNSEDVTVLEDLVRTVDGVRSIKELQAWSLDGLQHVMTVRIVVRQDASTDTVRDLVRAKLKEKGYKFVTIEVDHETAELPHRPQC